MQSTYLIQDITTLKTYWLREIQTRSQHKSQSAVIARRAFDNTHESRIGFKLPPEAERVRFEFGALEAPGETPENRRAAIYFEDGLWRRLGSMVAGLDEQEAAA